MSVKERITEFIQYKKITATEFCQKIGVSGAFISSMRVSIQPDKINSIALNFPELNISWLMSGIGQMINGSASESTSAIDEAYRLKWENDSLRLEIDSLKLKNEKLIEEVAVLRYRLSNHNVMGENSSRRGTG